MTIFKEQYNQGYWVDCVEGVVYKAKIYISEDANEVLAKVRWEQGNKQMQKIMPIYPIESCKEMAQKAINLVSQQRNALRRSEIINQK